jgi:hypothetical protein
MAAKDEKNLAASIGLKEIDTDSAIAKIARDVLITTYRYPKDGKPLSDDDQKRNAKIQKVWEQWYETKWEDDEEKVLSALLLGPPGQGKTTSFKQAAMRVAAALEMNFKLNPDDEVSVGPNDFMFVSQEFSGENTITTIGGIPAKTVDKTDGTEYMTKLVNKRLAMARKAGGSLLLLDDFPNAAPNVQNVGLALTDEKRFQGLNLDHVYVGLTGNLGALDGTHTTRLSTALRGRCNIFYTEDKVLNWVTRGQQNRRWRDSIGMVGVDGYLLRETQDFAQMPNTKQSGGFPSPRTWDHLVIELRRTIRANGGSGKGHMKAMAAVEELASSILGLDVGLKFYSYYNSMMLGADPIARKMIMDGEFDEKAFKSKFGDGYSAEAQHFAYQYATALADYAITAIVQNGEKDGFSYDLDKNPKLRTIIQRFAQGVIPVNSDTFSFTLDHFKAKLANQVEEWSSQFESRRVLSTEVKKVFARIIAEDRNFTEEHKQIMVDTLSDINKFDTNNQRRRRR